MTPISRNELEALKAVARARGLEWGDQNWYEGHLDGEFIVAQTDTGTVSDSTREGLVRLRREFTFELGGREYAVVQDSAFGVLFAPVDP